MQSVKHKAVYATIGTILVIILGIWLLINYPKIIFGGIIVIIISAIVLSLIGAMILNIYEFFVDLFKDHPNDNNDIVW